MEILIWCEACGEKTMHTAVQTEENIGWTCNPCKERQLKALKRFRHDVINETIKTRRHD